MFTNKTTYIYKVIKNYFHIILLFFCINLFAQETIRYTTKEGLPSNHIYDIQEDANGFMWFATNRGLVKYDGDTFKTFTIKDGLPNNDTWLLETDLKGRLWYFSKSNYQGYFKNDSIYKFPTKDNKVISPRFIYKSKETLWMHSSSGMQTVINDTIRGVGVYKEFNREKYYNKIKEVTNKYDYYSTNDLTAHNLKSNEYAVLKVDKVLFLDKDFKLLHQTNINAPKDHRNFKIDNLGLMCNQIFYYGLDRGILFIDFKSKSTKYYSYSDLINVESIKYLRVKSLEDEIQVSIPGSLLIFDYDLNFKSSYSFPKELGRTSHKDSKGNIWLADFTNGVSLIPASYKNTNYYLKNKKVQKINKIDSVFYAGVNDDGFYKFEDSLHKFNSFARLKRQNGEIYQIEKKGNNKTFFVSSGGTFFKENDLITKVNFLDYNNKFAIKNVTIFIGKNFIISGDYISEVTRDFLTKRNSIFKPGLLTAAAFNNQLYYGSSDGLYIKEKDTLIRPKNKNNLTEISILNFLSTKKYLIIGTDGRGVYFYDENNVIHLKNTDGYSIQKIVKKDNNLWLATNKGVHNISLDQNDLEKLNIENSFYEADGLLQNNTNDIYLEKDTLFAASDAGISKINITDKIYSQKPYIYFKTKNDTLSYVNEKRDNITINFSALDYVNQDNISYQYRLLPYQANWKMTTTKTLNFSNLSPELHQLEVKATDQHLNTTTVSQYLNLKPTWWQTSLAKIGFAVLALLGFLGFIKILQKRIQAKEQAKVQLDKKIAGLELQALRSQMNPHFVHNSLNAIQYYIQRNEVEQSENYLVRFSKLVRLFFEYSRKQNISIKDEITLLNNYLEIEKLRFEDKLSYIIDVDKNIEAEEQIIPSMILQPIVENAVNHGLFHKTENGLLTVSFSKININSFKVIVEDDGIGINKSKKMYKDSSKNYQSKSSAVLEERLELLQQSNEWEIEYSIKDLSEIKNTNGTRVTLIFNKSKL